MRKSDLIFRISVIVIGLAITGVLLFRFVLNKDQKNLVAIDNPDKITLFSVDEEVISLSQLMGKSKTLYFVIFNLNDCYSCIAKGFDALGAMQKEGKNCAAIVIHEYVDEIKGWSEKQDFSPIYMMKRSVFYNYIRTPHVPLFVHISKGKIRNFQFITP